jgi:hypothetical protein
MLASSRAGPLATIPDCQLARIRYHFALVALLLLTNTSAWFALPIDPTGFIHIQTL